MFETSIGRSGLEVRPGVFVIAVPTIWKLESGADTADEVCLHVARETFGEDATLYEPETLSESVEIYYQAITALEAACAKAKRDFEVVDPFNYVVRIGGTSGLQRGTRWVRLVRVPEPLEH